jgi:hypothetical protein
MSTEAADKIEDLLFDFLAMQNLRLYQNRDLA